MDDIRIRHSNAEPGKTILVLPEAEITVCGGHIVEVGLSNEAVAILHEYLGLWLLNTKESE